MSPTYCKRLRAKRYARSMAGVAARRHAQEMERGYALLEEHIAV